MNRSEKESLVEDLNRMFKVSTSVLLINFEGINVLAQSELRRKISKVDSGYQVIKNRLALRAVEDTSLEVLREHFQGPTAIAYTGGDPVALAKVLKDFISDHPSVAFKAGVVEGKTFSASDVELLAKMPSRPELMSKLVYLLNAPLVRLATALQSPLRGLASVLKQLAEKKQASGEGSADSSSTDNRQQTTDSGQADQETTEQEAAAPEPKEQQAEERTPAPEAAEQEAAQEPEKQEPVEQETSAPEPEKPDAKEQETAAQEPEAQEETAPETAAEGTAEEPVAEATAAEEATAPEAAAEETADQEAEDQGAADGEPAAEETAAEETTDKEKKDEETKDS